MTVGATLQGRDWMAAGAMPRGVLAGAAWGLTMGLGLPLLNFANCGVIRLSNVAFTTAVSVVAGGALIGPLAAFRSTSATD
jgi:hypothetical protein